MNWKPFAAILPLGMLLIFGVTNSKAQGSEFGLRGGIYTNSDNGFVGAELLSAISPRVYFNPNMEYVMADNATFMTFNADMHYDFHTRSRNYIWAGAGLGVLYVNPEGASDGNTDLGLNLLFGIGIPTRSVTPYIQAKAILSETDDFVLAFGIRF